MSTTTAPAPGAHPANAATRASGPGLFRFATAGSVDDGKSTLVGRLLHDSKAILADQLDALARTSAQRGFGGDEGGLDLALLTDGLRAEREQGITIDVAYRYFATARRDFILADCPGHVQYTKNTVTGASTADAVIVLIDARHGVVEQTRRHLSVLALLRVPHVIVAVNKIDLVGYAREPFEAIEADVRGVAGRLGLADTHVVPVSALLGDNVVEPSRHTDWYSGPTILGLLETLGTSAAAATRESPLRFAVQHVIRPQGALSRDIADAELARYRDYRAYAGQVASGSVAVGDEVTVLPAGVTTRVTGIRLAQRDLAEAVAPQSVAIELADDIDIARGDLIVAASEVPPLSEVLDAELAWLSPKRLTPGSRVLVKHGTKTVQARVQHVAGRLNLNTFGHEIAEGLELNDIGIVQLRLASALPLEPYAAQRLGGAFLVIDPLDGNTLAAGLVRRV
ncbi:sulfate adenylyltransferase [Micrococcales bacterium 31B]|nr:sulfate adenylyltransferase [Micrococcales bacterium 31B]